MGLVDTLMVTLGSLVAIVNGLLLNYINVPVLVASNTMILNDTGNALAANITSMINNLVRVAADFVSKL